MVLALGEAALPLPQVRVVEMLALALGEAAQPFLQVRVVHAPVVSGRTGDRGRRRTARAGVRLGQMGGEDDRARHGDGGQRSEYVLREHREGVLRLG